MSYKSKVLEIGPMVAAFEEELLVVLFGPSAPDALREISVIHEHNGSEFEEDLIKEGTTLEIGNFKYTVKSVGSLANANFIELGHISVYFKSEMDDLLPGAIQVEPEVFPQIELGQEIKFYN